MPNNLYRLPTPEREPPPVPPPANTRITWASDLRRREGPADDIAEVAIPKREACLFAGRAGYGKSYLSLLLQAATATGKDWIGLTTRRCRSLGIYSEDRNEHLAIRRDKICQHFAIDEEDLTEWAAVMPNDGQDFVLFSCGYAGFREGHPRPLWDQIERRIQEDGIELLILDNARNVYQGLRSGPQSETHVNSFMRFLNRKAFELDCAIVLICNPPKDGSSYFAGSQVWEDAARHTLSLSAVAEVDPMGKPIDSGKFVLKVEKGNYLPYNHPIKRRGVILEWENDVLVNVDDGEPEPLGSLGKLALRQKMVEKIELAINKYGHEFAASPLSKRYIPSVMSREGSKWSHISWNDKLAAYESLLADGGLIKVAVKGAWMIRTPHSHPYLGESE